MKLMLDPESIRKPLAWLGFPLIAVIGSFDYLTGYEYAFSLFYVLPIAIVTWYASPKLGGIACVVSAIVWQWADIATGHLYSSPLVPYWNTLIRLSFFIIITLLLSAIKNLVWREREMSHTDYLTGASNSRHFYEIVQIEINRLQRNPRPFSVAYIDVDDFKTINDEFGHAEGDLILKTIVKTVKSRIRNTDVIARLGGDEMALFFPDTDKTAAQVVFDEINETLLKEMKKNHWMVTFSAGVVTFVVAPDDVNELLKIVDSLMYSAKRDGKNRVKYSLYASENLVKEVG
jgi:diguanylate cyclase (GGDEF)-like protein